MPLFTPFRVKDDLQPSPTKSKRMKIDHAVAERTFMLFRRDGTSFAVTVRLGAPFVGKAHKHTLRHPGPHVPRASSPPAPRRCRTTGPAVGAHGDPVRGTAIR